MYEQLYMFVCIQLNIRLRLYAWWRFCFWQTRRASNQHTKSPHSPHPYTHDQLSFAWWLCWTFSYCNQTLAGICPFGLLIRSDYDERYGPQEFLLSSRSHFKLGPTHQCTNLSIRSIDAPNEKLSQKAFFRHLIIRIWLLFSINTRLIFNGKWLPSTTTNTCANKTCFSCIPEKIGHQIMIVKMGIVK